MVRPLIQTFLEKLAGCCRVDAHGQFNVTAQRGYKTVTKSVTADVIRAHAANKKPIMVFPLSGDQTRIGVLDFDNHDDSLTWEQVVEPVRAIIDSLQADGLKPLLFRSSRTAAPAWLQVGKRRRGQSGSRNFPKAEQP